MTKKVSKESLKISEEKIEQLKKVIPEVFTEGKIDFEKLQRTLGKEINGKDEKYSFNWAGRKDTFKNIQTTAKGTLKPAEKESVSWDSTENLFIEGDNLEALKLLQKTYFNKIKMIFIDPPYNTGKDFVYKDNFRNSIKSYLEQTGQSSIEGFKLTTNLETSGRFHSDWISMIYSRLFIARNLLKDEGVIFVSIDDGEVHNLRKILDEIFGEENFVANIIWEKKYSPANDSKWISDNHDHILLYAKDKNQFNCKLLPRTEEMNKRYQNIDNDPRGDWKPGGLSAKTYSSKYDYPIKTPSGRVVNPPKGSCWQVTKERFEELVKDNRVYFGKNNDSKPQIKQFLTEVQQGMVAKSIWSHNEVGHNQISRKEIVDLFGEYLFDTPKPTDLIIRMLLLSTNKNEDDIILDFFAGSGSTAHAVLKLNNKDGGNRKFICVQLPEKINKKSPAYDKGFSTVADVCKERIRRVIKNLEKNKKNNLDLGFKVFKLDKSNYKIWEKYEGKDAKELKKQLELFKTPLISGYKNEDVIYECIIKEGYSLNSKIENTDVKSNKVFKVIDGDLFFYISLDQEIKDKTIDELKLKKENMFICLDEALNDSKKKNLSIQCNLKTI
jgi:adenine-specific DNA-methyltransferase